MAHEGHQTPIGSSGWYPEQGQAYHQIAAGLRNDDEDDDIQQSHGYAKPPQSAEKDAASYEQVLPASPSPLPTSHWQDGPQRLPRRDIIQWLWDFCLSVMPVGFIVLAILALRLDGHPESRYGRAIVELSRLGPSLYPILFTAVAGRFFRHVARWRLEQRNGVRLGVVEQVFGSQSLVSAMERLLFVRTHLVIGAVILAIWTLSPLGGQSSSRLIYMGENTETTPGTAYYALHSNASTLYASASSADDTGSAVKTLYSSCLLSSPEQKLAPVDMWGLPKIPQWPAGYEDADTVPVNSETLSSGPQRYSSLMGTTISGLGWADSAALLDMTIQSSYIDFSCSIEEQVTHLKDLDAYGPGGVFNASDFDFEADPRITFMANTTTAYGGATVDPQEDMGALHVLYASLDLSEEHWRSDVRVFNCSMQTVTFLTDLACGPFPTTTCQARALRRHPDIPLRSNIIPVGLSSVLFFVMPAWAPIAGDVDAYRASPTDNFLAGEQYPYAGQDMRTWNTTDAAELSQRMTTAFNTYWQAGLNPLNFTHVDWASEPQRVGDGGVAHGTEQAGELPWGTRQAEAAAHVTTVVYRADIRWVTILLLATLVLQVLASLGALLRLFIRAPDILGYASSFTRDSIQMPLLQGNSALDGTTRARLLGNLRVQIADIAPQGSVGYVAFRAVPPPGGADGHLPLDKKRLYI